MALINIDFVKLKKLWEQLAAVPSKAHTQAGGVEKKTPPDAYSIGKAQSADKEKAIGKTSSGRRSYPKKRKTGKPGRKKKGRRRDFRVVEGGHEFSALWEDQKPECFKELFSQYDEDVDVTAVAAEKGDLIDGRRPVAGGAFQPSMEIDLHGCTAEQARLRIETFIERAIFEHATMVGIITGRGLHSDGPPVLPGVAEQVLDGLRGRKMISSYGWEGGSVEKRGTLNVRLRK